MKKAVLFCANSQIIGGGESYLLSVMKYIKDNTDNKVFLLTRPFDKIAAEAGKIGIDIYPFFMGEKLGFKNIYDILFWPIYIVKAILAILRISEKYEIEIIHMQYIKDKMIFSTACNFLSYHYIWTEHGPLIKIVRKFPFIFFYKLLGELSEKIICVSENTKNSLLGSNINNSKVIYNGIDINKFKEIKDIEYLKKEFNIKNNDIVISCICAVSKNRGQDILIKTATELLKKYDNLKILIVGNGDKLDNIRKLISVNLKEKIICTGFRKDVIEFNQLSDIIVSVSYAQGEGLPTRIIEAMACSKPVIATDNGGTEEEVIDNITGIIIKKSDELYKAIEKLILNKKLRIELGKNGKLRAEKLFSQKKFLEKTKETILTNEL